MTTIKTPKPNYAQIVASLTIKARAMFRERALNRLDCVKRTLKAAIDQPPGSDQQDLLLELAHHALTAAGDALAGIEDPVFALTGERL